MSVPSVGGVIRCIAIPQQSLPNSGASAAMPRPNRLSSQAFGDGFSVSFVPAFGKLVYPKMGFRAEGPRVGLVARHFRWDLALSPVKPRLLKACAIRRGSRDDDGKVVRGYQLMRCGSTHTCGRNSLCNLLYASFCCAEAYVPPATRQAGNISLYASSTLDPSQLMWPYW